MNTRFSASLILIGWLCLSANVCAQAFSFIAPKDRPQLEASKPWPQNQFLVLAYHDVEDDAADQRYLSVRTSALNEQISWLLHNGYHVISVQDILDAHDGKKRCRPKPFCSALTTATAAFTPASGHCFRRGTSLRSGRRWAAGWIRRKIKKLTSAA